MIPMAIRLRRMPARCGCFVPIAWLEPIPFARSPPQEEVRTAAQAFQLDLRQGVTFRESQRNPASYVVPGNLSRQGGARTFTTFL